MHPAGVEVYASHSLGTTRGPRQAAITWHARFSQDATPCPDGSDVSRGSETLTVHAVRVYRWRPHLPRCLKRLALDFLDADKIVAVGSVVAFVAATRRRYTAAVVAVVRSTLVAGSGLEE